MTGYYQVENGILKRYTGREEVIQVPEGIHTIGEGAFKGCVSLKKVVLPCGLRRIMGDAFKGCRRLEEVEIPDGVSYIGRYAFHRCHALKQAILPPSVEELGEYAFLYCDSLKQVHIPGVKRLGMEAFANDMSLEKLVISRELEECCICDVFSGCARVTKIAYADGESYCIPNVVGVAAGEFEAPPLIELIVKDILRMMELEGRCLIRFRVNIKHVEVPEGIEVLAKSSFYDMRGILDIILPKSLKQIESRAFRNCISLERVAFGGDEVQIDDDAFRNCTSLKSVRLCDGTEYLFSGLSGIYRRNAGALLPGLGTGGTVESEKTPVSLADVPKQVQVIHRQVLGNFRISGTMLLQYLGVESRVVVPEGITMIAEEAFAGNETIDKVLLPESLKEIGAEAFRGCLLLQKITLPKGLCRIGAGAFEDCVKLLRIDIPPLIDVLEGRMFRRCRALQEADLPEGLVKINESAFYGCHSLKKIRLPESLAFIGKMAFYRSGLREVRIPKKAEYVESLAFAGSSLQRAWISGGYATGKHYGTDVFGNCDKLKALILEEGVCHIPDKFAYGCEALERVTLPQTLESAGRHAWEGTAFLEQWKQHAAQAEDAILWDGQNFEGKVRIAEHVRIVAGGAFYGNTKITEIYLPKQVQSIGAAAFKGCKALKRVFLSSHIRCLESEVFSGCGELEEVLLTEALTESSALQESVAEQRFPAWCFIGERAFYQCGKLRRLRLEQVEYIGKKALQGCASLFAGVVNPALIAGEGAFAGTRLGEQMESGLHIVGSLVVCGEDFAGDLCLPEGIKGIAPYAFAGNRTINRLVLPKSIQWIGEGAFFGCSRLLRVVFPKGLRRIDAHAFEKCISLKEAVSVVQQAGEAAFAGCIALAKVHLPQLGILEKSLFSGCVSLESCLCENARAVRAYCFSGCRSLQDYNFASLYEVGEYAFNGCESLKCVEFQDGVCLGPHGLEDCCGLERICLSGPQGVVHLKEYALSGCTLLQQVVYLKKEWTFRCYGDIFSENIPETVRLLYHSAFSCFVVGQGEILCGYRGAASKVKIPDGIRRIEAEVFRDAMLLEQVEIPKSVDYIGARAFHGTAWMTQERKKSPMVVVRDMLLDGSGCVGNVIIPADMRLVCGWAFANGLDIERIQFLSEKVRVEEYAFRNCISLRELILPNGAIVRFAGLEDRKRELPPLAKQAVMDSLNCFKTDEEGVLMECTGNISRLRLAYGITEVGDGAFQDGNLLTTITFSKTVKRIGRHAFAGCKWLSEVRQADGVECIGDMAFSGCGSLRYVELSENFRQMGVRAFENCTLLEEIRIPEGVEEIPERAFYRCHNLKKIQLPSTLKRIGREAFAFCKEAHEIQAPDGVFVAERAFYREV